MEKPTCEQLNDEEGVKAVYRHAYGAWRHGSYVTEVYHRPADDTYWRAYYRLSSDGETNELREGTAQIIKVRPVQKTVTTYEPAE